MFLSITFLLFAAAVAVFRREYAPESDWRTGARLDGIRAGDGAVRAGHYAAVFLAVWRRICLSDYQAAVGFLLPVLLLLDRNWRAIDWTMIFRDASGAVDTLFGLESWTAYPTETVAYQR